MHFTLLLSFGLSALHAAYITNGIPIIDDQYDTLVARVDPDGVDSITDPAQMTKPIIAWNIQGRITENAKGGLNNFNHWTLFAETGPSTSVSFNMHLLDHGPQSTQHTGVVTVKTNPFSIHSLTAKDLGGVPVSHSYSNIGNPKMSPQQFLDFVKQKLDPHIGPGRLCDFEFSAAGSGATIGCSSWAGVVIGLLEKTKAVPPGSQADAVKYMSNVYESDGKVRPTGPYGGGAFTEEPNCKRASGAACNLPPKKPGSGGPPPNPAKPGGVAPAKPPTKPPTSPARPAPKPVVPKKPKTVTPKRSRKLL